jgi:hypothetical protein
MPLGWNLQGGFEYLASGAYAEVFVHKMEKRVRKVFLKTQDRSHVEQVFLSEVEAYKRARADVRAAPYVPCFYHCGPVEILDATGRANDTLHYNDVVYELEWIDSRFTKLNMHKSYAVVRQIFLSAGIPYVIDASVAEVDDGILKVIDFGIEEIEPWHKD